MNCFHILFLLSFPGILCFFHILLYEFDDKFPLPENNGKGIITLWSSDFHISPIADIKDILSIYRDVYVIDKSLSGHCHITKTCAKDLAVIGSTEHCYSIIYFL